MHADILSVKLIINYKLYNIVACLSNGEIGFEFFSSGRYIMRMYATKIIIYLYSSLLYISPRGPSITRRLDWPPEVEEETRVREVADKKCN